MSDDADVPNCCNVFMFWAPSDEMPAVKNVTSNMNLAFKRVSFGKRVQTNLQENRSVSKIAMQFDHAIESHNFCSFNLH